jgi:hypothetical protein
MFAGFSFIVFLSGVFKVFIFVPGTKVPYVILFWFCSGTPAAVLQDALYEYVNSFT